MQTYIPRSEEEMLKANVVRTTEIHMISKFLVEFEFVGVQFCQLHIILAFIKIRGIVSIPRGSVR